MKVKSMQSVAAQPVEMDGAEGASIRVMIGPNDGAPNFVMRVFELAPGGHTPRHAHAWEHEVYILSGSCTIRGPAGDVLVKTGEFAYLAPDEEHQFDNTGREPMRFICVVPKS